MLIVNVPLVESFNEDTGELYISKTAGISLEHSLASLSKWESKWEKPFFTTDLTNEQMLDYIQCMITSPYELETLGHLSQENVAQINEYINAKMTATWFSDKNNRPKPSREVITAELIYYWMTALQIPFECQYWHLNKLLTLVKVANEKNAPPKKMSPKQAAEQQRSLNAQRKAALKSRG